MTTDESQTFFYRLPVVERLLRRSRQPLKDYRFVRGVCYTAWRKNDSATIEREMGYATRGIKMAEDVLKQNTKGFQNKSASTSELLNVRSMVPTCWKAVKWWK